MVTPKKEKDSGAGKGTPKKAESAKQATPVVTSLASADPNNTKGLPRSLVEACEGEKGILKPEELYAIVKRALGDEGDEGEKIEDLVEDAAWPVLSKIAEHLCQSTLQFALKLTEHRGGSTVESRDIARYLRTNMQLDVHARDMEEQRTTNALKRRAQSTPHLERQEVAKRLHREKE